MFYSSPCLKGYPVRKYTIGMALLPVPIQFKLHFPRDFSLYNLVIALRMNPKILPGRCILLSVAITWD
jgi:hypothetical protein